MSTLLYLLVILLLNLFFDSHLLDSLSFVVLCIIIVFYCSSIITVPPILEVLPSIPVQAITKTYMDDDALSIEEILSIHHLRRSEDQIA